MITFIVETINALVDVFDQTHVLLHCVVEAVDVGQSVETLVGHEGGNVGGGGGQHGYNDKYILTGCSSWRKKPINKVSKQ